jgi:cell wall-associated NlpC family hydrolase
LQQPGEFLYLCGVKRFGIILLAALAVASCGLTRRTPAVREPEAPIIPPLTDSADIARTRARAQAVMDSIDLVRSGVTVPKQDEGIRISSGVVPVPEPPKELVDEILDYAKTFIGVPYLLGASGPERFDCSGFTSYVFREFGYDLPHNSVQQCQGSRPVESFSELRKGDLVFFGARGSIRSIGHVGIVVDVDLERGMFHFIHASTSNGVEIQRSTSPYFMMRYMGAGRVLPE